MLSRLLYFTLWLLHFLPLPLLALVGRGVGWLLYVLARPRREVAMRNLELCFPELDLPARRRLARRHFQWLGRSLLERGLQWHAPFDRLRRLIQVEGDIKLAERSDRPVMWLVPHFLGLELAAVALQLFQAKNGVDIYQPQSDPYWDRMMKKGRTRFKLGEAFPRDASIRPIIKRIREGYGFFNMPDMDFGARDAVFVPFFGVPAATLMAPSRMARALDMIVQPVVAEMLPGGAGYKVRFLDPLPGFPSDDAEADTVRMNRFIESQARANPEQYLWVHKRFKTRPPGEPSLYRAGIPDGD